MTQTARGEFVVSLKPLAFEGADPEFKLGRMSIDKQISGDLTASTTGQMLSATTNTDGPALLIRVMVSLLLRGLPMRKRLRR